MEVLVRCVNVCAKVGERWPNVCVVVSSLLFRLLHRLLGILPRPVAVEKIPWRLWKWRNLSVSMVHSLLTGVWAIACVVQSPVIVGDLYHSISPLSYLLVCVSSGYFIQDAGDIIFSGYARGSWEFLLHHILVLWGFLYSVQQRRYVAGMVVALFVEVNSVFLHSRQMLKLASVANTSRVYTVIKLLNLLTFVSFRLGAQFYLTYYIINNYTWLDHAPPLLATIMIMNVMMLVYLWRLIRADFYYNQCCHDKSTDSKSDKFHKD